MSSALPPSPLAPLPIFFSSKQKHINFVDTLPYELSLMVFDIIASIGDTLSLVNCYCVSTNWNALAQDNQIYKTLFSSEKDLIPFIYNDYKKPEENESEQKENSTPNIARYFFLFTRTVKDLKSHPDGLKEVSNLLAEEDSLASYISKIEECLALKNREIAGKIWDLSDHKPNNLNSITAVSRNEKSFDNRKSWTIHGTSKRDYRYHDDSEERMTRIPPGILKMTNLKILKLPRNNLTHLPVEMESLQKLEVIDLTENPIRHFPAILSKLPNLKEAFLPETIDKRTIPSSFKRDLKNPCRFYKVESTPERQKPTHTRKRSKEHFQPHHRRRSSKHLPLA